MYVLIISDHEVHDKYNKNIQELLSCADYVIEKNYSKILEKITIKEYRLVVFLTINPMFPNSWKLHELKTSAAVVTMTQVDKLDLVIFSSFLRSVGLVPQPIEESGKADDIPQVLYKSLVFIEENIHENDLSLAKVASNVYISRCHYSRMFKTFFGTGFKEYVIHKRIQRAKNMLQEGKTVTDVCYSVGYGDLTHFGRVFKKIVGINPSVYRKQHLQRTLKTG